MPGDVLIKAGDKISKIYIILDGKAELTNFELELYKTYVPGDIFGGFKSKQLQLGFV